MKCLSRRHALDRTHTQSHRITKGVALMRRRADGWLNATQILKVAGFDKPQRTRILERDVQKGEHEKVQGGYGKYQGTWVPLDRGLEIAQEYHIEDFIRPIVNFKPSAQSPPPAPKHITQPSAKRKARDDRSSMSTRSVRDSVRGDSSDEQDELNSDDDAVSNSLDASEPSRTPSPITAGRLAAPAMLRSPMPPVTRRLRQRRDDSIPEVTIAKPSNTPQDPIQRAYSEQILEYFISDSSQIPDLLLNPPADFDPNIAIDDDLHAPLHWACAMGRIRIVKLLISAGADIYRVNKLGQTALMRSVMFANNYDVRKFPELYELLHNVTLHIDIFNRTVFHHIIDLAMSKGKTHASRYYLETMLGRLSEYPKELADVINWRDEDGETALTMAARCRSKRICKLLIDHGANPKVTNNDGKSAEMYIIEDEKFRASPILGPRSVSALSFR
ncbi:apses-domain-containing protein, partial [Exidia glandulosa HHB12029]